jgi:VWFA-related protein
MPDLPQSAFTVLEDGIPQVIKSFTKDAPISMGVIIDNSMGMRDQRHAIRVAAFASLRALNQNGEAFVVNFNDEAFLDSDFSNDTNVISAGFAKIASRGEAAAWDAISMSIDHLSQKAKNEKRVILIITGGNDNASVETLETLIQDAQRHDVTVYAVGLLGGQEKKEARAASIGLNLLAESTGGKALFPKDADEAAQMMREITDDIRSQYSIAYAMTNRMLDGSFRKVTVSVKAAGKPSVRTRPGYFAGPFWRVFGASPAPSDNK